MSSLNILDSVNHIESLRYSVGREDHPLESGSIIIKGTVNLLLKTAFHSHQGLVVPVIRNVEAMNYADIERTISELGEKVKWKVACVSAAGQVREEGLGKAGLTSGQCLGNWSLAVLGEECRARGWQSPPGAKV